MPGTVEKMHKAMVALVGTTEHPPGSNHNAITTEFGFDGAWCDMTVSVAGKHAGERDIIGWFAYTPSHAKWFLAQNRFHVGAAGIHAGCIPFFAWYGPHYESRYLGICHVGYCVGTRADGRIVTIEGNTGVGVVAAQNRARTFIAGYGIPAYLTGVSTTPIPPSPHTQPPVKHKPAPKPVPPTLHKGSHGNWVKVLQRKLAHLVADGDFGPKTEAAVRVFQRTHGLHVDGVVGPKTWHKLGY